MKSCLKSCGLCGSAKKLPGCVRLGTRKSRRAFGRALGEEGRFEFEEAVGVEVVAEGLGDAMADDEVLLQSGAAQVEPARFEPQFLVRGGVVADLEGRRRRLAQDLKVGNANLDLAGGELAGLELGRDVPLAAMGDSPAHHHARFAAHVFGAFEDVARRLVAEAELREPVAVAKVDEHHARDGRDDSPPSPRAGPSGRCGMRGVRRRCGSADCTPRP